MGNMPMGFADKLYWRRYISAVWHCYKKCEGGGYVSLCGDLEIERSGGQACRRPAQVHRCLRCESAEMVRRKWDKPGPENVYPDQQQRLDQ